MSASIPIPAVVLNLKRSPERRAHMEKQLKGKGLSYRFFDAVDGQALTKEEYDLYDEKRAIKWCRRSLVRGEIGCALSHLRIYEHMIKANMPRLLIIEDDIVFENTFFTALKHVSEWLPPMWSLINFSMTESPYFSRGSYPIWTGGLPLYPLNNALNHTLYYCLHQFQMSSCYLINLPTAKRLLSVGYPIGVPADVLFGDIKWSRLHGYTILPTLVSHQKVKSEIDNTGNRRTTQKLSLKGRLLIYRVEGFKLLCAARYFIHVNWYYSLFCLRYKVARREIPMRMWVWVLRTPALAKGTLKYIRDLILL